ncbi:MAG: phage tail protein I, partial [Rhodocyclaceae bacterium]|nr:phage tail protein I [Rhodocyclaceae bacterium]
RFAATDEQRRRLIREAIALHRKKGTPAALKGIVRAATGWEMTIEEWWQYGAPPFTWRGVIWATSATPGRPLTPGLLQQLQQMLQEWRPVSRHGSLRLGARFAARPLMACAALRVTGAARRSLTVRSPALRPESAAAACAALRVSAVVHFRITL